MRKLTKEEILKEVADIENDSKWGQKNMIYMKKISSAGFPQLGLMLRDQRSVIFMSVQYPSLVKLVADGWVVD